jgi:hypothetical protein
MVLLLLLLLLFLQCYRKKELRLIQNQHLLLNPDVKHKAEPL